MAKSTTPTTDQELTARVDALEVRMTTAERAIVALDTRVTALESGTVDPQPPDPPEPTGRTPLSVTVTLKSGTEYIYHEVDGVEAATRYVDPRGEFEQRNIVCKLPGLQNFYVLIRPDVSGEREEVIFENTSIANAVNPGIMDTYNVVISAGTNMLYEATAPNHYGNARWRWQSERRPVREQIPDLIQRGLLPNYKEALATNTPASRSYTYEIMGLAGVTGAMQGTGERPDIGPVTEYQADYICTGRNLETVLAQGEAAGTLPYHWRDPATGAWLDAFATAGLKASQYNSGTPNPYLPTDWKLNPDNGDRVATIQCDTAHMPALAYLPWLLTGDPYYLEELHATIGFDIMSQPWNGREYNIWFAIRAHAWALRSVMQAAKTTPDVTPSWILPKKFFVDYMNRNRDWLLSSYVNNNVPQYQVFATTEKSFGDNNEAPAAPQGTYSQTYMEEFELAIFCWIVRMGFTDWKPIAEWKAKNTIGRTDGKSGWIRAVSTPYRQLLKNSKAEPFFTTWQQSWTLTQQRYSLTYSDPNKLAITGNDISYPSYTEGALASARSIGIAAANAPHDWIHGEVNSLIAATTARSRARKWCIAGG